MVLAEVLCAAYAVEPSGWVESLIENLPYLGPFIILVLCGVGLPIPEEVTLLFCGLLIHKGAVEFELVTGVCASAILLGDSIPFFLGRHYGEAAVGLPWIRRFLRPDRMKQLRRRFAEHGTWVIFSLRFLPGIRVGGYFTVGMLRASFLRFFLLDTLGVLISVPISIYLGMLFADQIEDLEARLGGLSLILGFCLLSVFIILGVRSRSRRRARLETLREERQQRLEKSTEEKTPLDPQ